MLGLNNKPLTYMNDLSVINNEMEELRIMFDGHTHQIEANTFINSLLHFTSIVQETNREITADKKRVEIKIKATPKGSFLVDLAIATYPAVNSATALVFSKDAVSHVTNLVKTVSGLYNLHKFLDGKKPKDVSTIENSVDNSIKIENNTGDVTYFDNRTFNIYQGNKTIRQAMTSEFATLESDANVTGFELLDKDDSQLVTIPRDKFAALTTAETFKSPQEKEIPKTGFLSIVTLSFEQKKKWDFIYEGNPITAKMSDDFYQTIDRGEKFAKGDQLEAELKIRQEFDESLNAYINKSYQIVKIIQHIPKPEQSALFK
jgi:hypothetical protein